MSQIPIETPTGAQAKVEAHDVDGSAHADIRALISAISTGAVEQAQDAVAALLAAGTHVGISFAYNDAGNAISATVSFPVSSVNGRTGTVTGLAEQSSLTAHINDGANPHGVSKSQVGLGNVSNLTPANMPVSTAQQAAIDAVVAAIPETVRDTIGTALVQGANISITANDAGDTITIAVSGLAPVATSGSATDLTTGTIDDARIPAAIARTAPSSRTMKIQGHRLGVLGDSLQSYGTESTSSSDVSVNGPYILKQVELLTHQRIRVTAPMQTPGAPLDGGADATAVAKDIIHTQLPALLALPAADLPNACVVAIGRNDFGASYNPVTYVGRIINEVCVPLQLAGIVPILFTSMPTDAAGAGSSVAKTAIAKHNTELRRRAAQYGFPLLDQYGALVDITGGLAAAYNNGDNTHLTRAGYIAVANSLIAQGIAELFPPAPVVTCRDAANPYDIFGGTGTFKDVSPSGWSSAGTGIVVTTNVAPLSWEPITSGGKWVTFKKPSGTSTGATAYRKTTGAASVVAGRVYEVACLMKHVGLAGSGATIQVALEWRNSGGTTIGTDLLLNNWQRDDLITLYGRFTAPTGVDNVRFVTYQKDGTPTQDVTTYLSAAHMLDRTSMGVA